METHLQIEERSLSLAQAVAEKIDRNPSLLEGVHSWALAHPDSAGPDWLGLLTGSWPEIRQVLLDPEAEGRRLRQNSPFVGILTPQERWKVYREFSEMGNALAATPA